MDIHTGIERGAERPGQQAERVVSGGGGGMPSVSIGHAAGGASVGGSAAARTVLVVDDKEMLRDSVGITLTRAGMAVIAADGGQAALAQIARQRPDCVVTDLKMPGMDGLTLIEKIRAIDEDLPIILMTAFGTIETAVRAMKLGAFDYVTKPFEGDELLITIKRAIRHGELVRENAVLKNSKPCDAPKAASGAALVGLHRLVGDSPAMRRVKEQVLAVAESAGTVLICGESGTGKEVVARAVHELSPRDGQAFLGVNCAALSESLLESELFGHERGSFTGADKLRKGRFELADRGTLLLDEISEIAPRLQAKLLRVLQERSIERVGASNSIGVDVRVIATSNRDLPKSVGRGEFRQDLFFRLNVLPIHLPPLHDRLEDVAMLTEHFLRQIALRDGKPLLRVSPEALAAMQSYPWPGNVRELQNIAERAAVLCRSDTIGPELIRPWLGQGLVVAGHAQPLSMTTVIGRDELAEQASHEHAHASPYANGYVQSNAHAGSMPQAINGQHGHSVQNGHAHAYAQPISQIEGKPEASGPAGTIVQTPHGPVFEPVALSSRALEDIEREAIVTTLRKFNGHRQKTAMALGIGVRTL
nr:sigma-54 dependent transcriptional regulator [Phycisphaerales bacterium]